MIVNSYIDTVHRIDAMHSVQSNTLFDDMMYDTWYDIVYHDSVYMYNIWYATIQDMT